MIKNMKVIKHMFFNLFCFVAVLYYIAGDKEGGGGPFWDLFGIFVSFLFIKNMNIFKNMFFKVGGLMVVLST